jgi:endothelin-converting enzyme/putative endopeptidase
MRRHTLALLPMLALLDAQAFQQNLDRSVKPCENFFQYACGGWIKANPIPPEQGRWGSFDKLQEANRKAISTLIKFAQQGQPAAGSPAQQVGDFNAACMDAARTEQIGLSALVPKFDALGKVQSKADLPALIALFHESGVDAFFSLTARPDFKNANRYLAELSQAGLSLPDRDYYTDDTEKAKALRTKYVDHVERMFRLIGAPATESSLTAEAVMRVEAALARAHLDKVSRRIPERVYNIRKRTELAVLAPDFDWHVYLSQARIPAFENLNVTHPDFVSGFNRTLTDLPLADLKAYLAWRMLLASFPMLPESFVKENFAFFDAELNGAKQAKSRERRCIEATDQALPDALGKLYVEKHFGMDAKARMQVMVGNIIGAFGANLQTVAWMTAETRSVAKEKADAMRAKIGYPDKWRDTSQLSIRRDDPLGNLLRANAHERARNVARIGQPVDKTEWFMSAPTVNAFYSSNRNDINFPAGILQPPFFDPKGDEAVNYGAIGMVIGHEITHGFDDRGRKFDKDGNLTEWWQKADAEAFEKQAACLVEQYDNYSVGDGIKLNGRLTLGENIADLGGARIALKAYLMGKPNPDRIGGFTPEQRFFLGLAQVWCSAYRPEMARTRALTDAHSQPVWRVNGIVSNMPEFAQAFSCKAGQPMVRKEVCRVW